MADADGPDQLVTITLERWRWEQVLLCLDRYVAWLRGDYSEDDAMSDDVEWADELGWMTDDLRGIVAAGGNGGRAGEATQAATRVSETVVVYDTPTPPISELQRNRAWTATENAAVIDAYFWMLDEQDAFRGFNKAAKYRELQSGPLHIRSRQSVERKMQNISAVLQLHGLEWVEGLMPLKNFQADLGLAVEETLAARGMIDRVDPTH